MEITQVILKPWAIFFSCPHFPLKEPKFEQVDVESEKADEEDEEEIDSTAEDKKDYSEEEIERESGEEAVSDFGERSQSEKDEQEPGTSMKEFLLDRAGIGGTESVPGSPASQVSQGYVFRRL